MLISDIPASENIQTINENKIKTIIEDRIKTEFSQIEEFHSINYFYLFLARTYVLLNSDDSGFLAEFAFLWDETFPR